MAFGCLKVRRHWRLARHLRLVVGRQDNTKKAMQLKLRLDGKLERLVGRRRLSLEWARRGRLHARKAWLGN
ncbi:hypothetical protein Csa_017537 [Cucumis sativus]|uniref:Uncharacterized protein n=1 Tax=Cucumis sativus TaxID=3659 RepID=A0A0A0L843_CUCSA|nr:hypothetical protein Csa_017537 [Cucumis sativus]